MLIQGNTNLYGENVLTAEVTIDAKSGNGSVSTTRRRRRWLWRGLALLLACFPFALLEISLRVIDSRDGDQAIDYDPVVDLHQLKPLFNLDPRTNLYQIPDSRRNFFQPASFPAQKESSTKRIFVLGGSTVQGRPYAPQTAFSSWLQLRLQAADSKITFEVVNCGGVSYASYRLSRILREVLRYQPDAIVLYTGHNEFLEDRSYAEVHDLSAPRAWISRAGARLHTVRWLQRAFVTSQRTLLPMEVDARLDHADGLQQYHRDLAWRDQIQQHFDWTLRRMVDAASRAGVPLILCTPASDLVGTPPIKSEMLSTLGDAQAQEFTENWQRARDPDLDLRQRLDSARRCLVIDNQHCGAHFVVGRLLLEQGKVSAAKPHLIAARDFDVCPLRATTAMIDSVKMICQQNDIRLVDTITLLDQRSHDGRRVPDQIADPEFFIDHVHPTIAGHQIIGTALAEHFQRLGWIKNTVEATARYESLAQKHLNSLGESYYARGTQRLEGLRRWTTGRVGELGIDSLPETQNANERPDVP